MFSAFSLWADSPLAAFQLPVFWLWRGCQRQGTETRYPRHQVTGWHPPHPCSPLPCPGLPCLPRVQKGTGRHWEGPHLFPKCAAAEGFHDYCEYGRGPLTRRTGGEQRFAFCSGLGFTFGYSSGIVPAGRAWSGAVLLWPSEASAAPGGNWGDVGDQSAFGVCWVSPENNKLLVEHPPPARSPPPGLRNLPGRLRVTSSASAVTALGEVGPCVGLQDEEAVSPKLPGATCKWEVRPPAL